MTDDCPSVILTSAPPKMEAERFCKSFEIAVPKTMEKTLPTLVTVAVSPSVVIGAEKSAVWRSSAVEVTGSGCVEKVLPVGPV